MSRIRKTSECTLARSFAKWKRKNYGVEGATINNLVKIVQAKVKEFDSSERSREEALRILMLEFKADAYYFAALVREALEIDDETTR